MLNYITHPEDVWGNAGKAPYILKLSTRWKQVVSFTPWLLYSSGNHYTGGWMGRKDYMDLVEKIKISFPYQESNPYSSVVHPTAHHCIQWAVPVPLMYVLFPTL
jgi:hypothetical protein